MGSNPPLVHVTTVHARRDVRIFHKETQTLRALGRSVILVVADGLGNEAHGPGEVSFVDVGPIPKGRFLRALRGNARTFRTILKLKPAIVHFHDPELIALGVALKAAGYTVIYDVHEDVPKQILSKYWIPPALRKAVSLGAAAAERVASWCFDGFVPTTPRIARKFPAGRTVVVHNYPDRSELVSGDPIPYGHRAPHVLYIGGITETRGAREMLNAMALLDQGLNAQLELAGSIDPPEFAEELRKQPGWKYAIYHGQVDRPSIARLLGSTRAGLVTLQPTPAHMVLISIKMFEYMAAGLPVIASDFPTWRSIIGDARCGLLVDPTQPAAIAEAITWILTHPEEAEAMGRRGQAAVASTFNWENEGQKLIALYERLLSAKKPGTMRASAGISR